MRRAGFEPWSFWSQVRYSITWSSHCPCFSIASPHLACHQCQSGIIYQQFRGFFPHTYRTFAPRWHDQDLNPGEKQECYLCAMLPISFPPRSTIVCFPERIKNPFERRWVQTQRACFGSSCLLPNWETGQMLLILNEAIKIVSFDKLPKEWRHWCENTRRCVRT